MNIKTPAGTTVAQSYMAALTIGRALEPVAQGRQATLNVVCQRR